MRRDPKQTRSQAKVAEILTAAQRVLIDRGVENFTTNHVASEAGCNISTIYRYFPEKHEILHQLYHMWLADEVALNLAAVAEAKHPIDPATFVAELFRRHLETHDEDAHALAVELTKAHFLSKEIRAIEGRHEVGVVEAVLAHLPQMTSYSFTAEQVIYVFRLALSLLVMINTAEPEDRAVLSDMAIGTLEQTVRGFYTQG
jgi:AcrR family transcriptional regulator